MRFKTTRGYFGSFAVRPRRVKQFAPDGSPIYSESLRLHIVRIGIDAETKQAFGICDTNALSPMQKAAARNIWGDDWRKSLDMEVIEMGKSNGLVPMEPGESPPQTVVSGPRVVSGARTVSNRRPGRPRTVKRT